MPKHMRDDDNENIRKRTKLPKCFNLALTENDNGKFVTIQYNMGEWELDYDIDPLPISSPPKKNCEGYLQNIRGELGEVISQDNLVRPYYAIKNKNVFATRELAEKSKEKEDGIKPFLSITDAKEYVNSENNFSKIYNLLKFSHYFSEIPHRTEWTEDEKWSVVNNFIQDPISTLWNNKDIVHLHCNFCYPLKALQTYIVDKIVSSMYRVYSEDMERPYHSLRMLEFDEISIPTVTNITFDESKDYPNIFQENTTIIEYDMNFYSYQNYIDFSEKDVKVHEMFSDVDTKVDINYEIIYNVGNINHRVIEERMQMNMWDEFCRHNYDEGGYDFCKHIVSRTKIQCKMMDNTTSDYRSENNNDLKITIKIEHEVAGQKRMLPTEGKFVFNKVKEYLTEYEIQQIARFAFARSMMSITENVYTLSTKDEIGIVVSYEGMKIPENYKSIVQKFERESYYLLSDMEIGNEIFENKYQYQI